jgi:hypothetical protein
MINLGNLIPERFSDSIAEFRARVPDAGLGGLEGSDSQVSESTSESSISVTSQASADGVDVEIEGSGDFSGEGSASFNGETVTASSSAMGDGASDTTDDSMSDAEDASDAADNGASDVEEASEPAVASGQTVTSNVTVTASSGPDGPSVVIEGEGDFFASGSASDGDTTVSASEGDAFEFRDRDIDDLDSLFEDLPSMSYPDGVSACPGLDSMPNRGAPDFGDLSEGFDISDIKAMFLDDFMM